MLNLTSLIFPLTCIKWTIVQVPGLLHLLLYYFSENMLLSTHEYVQRRHSHNDNNENQKE